MRFRHIISLTCAALLLSVMTCNAQSDRPRWRLGTEWGYSVAFFNHYHYCYPDPDIGYRVDDEQYVNIDYLGAYWLICGGYDISERFNASFGVGSMGIYDKRIVIPVVADVNWLPKGVGCDGPIVTLGGGVAVNSPRHKPIVLARTGAGYRFALSNWADLDFILRFRASLDHPRVWDADGGRYIDESVVLRNDALYFAVSLGMVLSF